MIPWGKTVSCGTLACPHRLRLNSLYTSRVWPHEHLKGDRRMTIKEKEIITGGKIFVFSDPYERVLYYTEL